MYPFSGDLVYYRCSDGEHEWSQITKDEDGQVDSGGQTCRYCEGFFCYEHYDTHECVAQEA